MTDFLQRQLELNKMLKRDLVTALGKLCGFHTSCWSDKKLKRTPKRNLVTSVLNCEARNYNQDGMLLETK